jgi:L-threonylcarbamoyladenylate synthase
VGPRRIARRRGRAHAHDDLLAILERTGPLAVTSANHTGAPTPREIEDVRAMLGDAVPLYVDGGAAKLDTGSTIVDLTGAQPRLLREGPISLADVERATGTTVARV